MKYEKIQVVGIRRYQTRFNNVDYTGVNIYGTYKSDSIQGTGTVSFKIKERQIKLSGADQIQIGKVYDFIVTTRQYDNGNKENIVEAVYPR